MEERQKGIMEGKLEESSREKKQEGKEEGGGKKKHLKRSKENQTKCGTFIKENSKKDTENEKIRKEIWKKQMKIYITLRD